MVGYLLFLIGIGNKNYNKKLFLGLHQTKYEIYKIGKLRSGTHIMYEESQIANAEHIAWHCVILHVIRSFFRSPILCLFDYCENCVPCRRNIITKMVSNNSWISII